MRSPRIEYPRRALRWLGPTALLALVPKCGLCLLAYTGIGVSLGLGGAEICGAPADEAGARGGGLAVLVLAGLAARLLLNSRTPGRNRRLPAARIFQRQSPAK